MQLQKSLPDLFGVSKPINKQPLANLVHAQEILILVPNPSLVGLGCHVSPWQIMWLTISVSGPIILNFSLFEECLVH